MIPFLGIAGDFDCTGNDSGMMNEFSEEPPPAKSAGEATKTRSSGSRDPVFGDRGFFHAGRKSP